MPGTISKYFRLHNDTIYDIVKRINCDSRGVICPLTVLVHNGKVKKIYASKIADAIESMLE